MRPDRCRCERTGELAPQLTAAPQRPLEAASMNRILWHSTLLDSAEHLHVTATDEGHRLSGTVVLPVEGRPAQIRYAVDVDERWRCRAAEALIDGAALQRRFQLKVDRDGRWQVDGQHMPELDGCVDVDLGWTPATNTLPIRRLGIRAGERAVLRAALVTFPELSIVASEQTYERIDAGRWRYASGSFSAELEVDPESGIVLRYSDIWTAVALD